MSLYQIKFGSVCSGLEAASVAWSTLGWKAAWVSEIEPYPCSVLAHHYPDVPNLGNMLLIPAMLRNGDIEAPDVFTGGTPCQSFSIAGLRNSLSDKRGNLSLTFCEIANEIDIQRAAAGLLPCVIKWENVPGVLSTEDNAFGCFLGGLAGSTCALIPEPCPDAGKSGKFWKWKKSERRHALSWPKSGCVIGPQRTVAWRVLDAQYFGLAQRRNRVFVVASARNGFDPVAVLLEFEGVRRDTAPSRSAGQEIAGSVTASLGKRGGQPDCGSTPGYLQPVAYGSANVDGPVDVSAPLLARPGQSYDFERETLVQQGVDLRNGALTGQVAQTIQAGGHGVDPGGMPHVLSVALRGRDGGGTAELGDDLAACLRASTGGGDKPHVLAPIAFNSREDCVSSTEVFGALGTSSPQAQSVIYANSGGQMAVAIGCDGTIDGPVPPLMARSSRGGAQTLSPGHQTDGHMIGVGMAVRRLMPIECERLQGFEDGYTLIPVGKKMAADGPRYKAIGNSWAIPCVRWIGRRIDSQLRKLMEQESA